MINEAVTTMTKTCTANARHDLLLCAFCALARALPREARLQIAQAVSADAEQLAAGTPTADEAVAADLARLLGALGFIAVDGAGQKDAV